MTPLQRALARHALGLPNARRCSYRNHFVGPSGENLEAWDGLVAGGLARRFTGSQLTGGDDCYLLTRDGAVQALDENERLDPEDFPSDEMIAALRRLNDSPSTATHWIAKACRTSTAAARRMLRRLEKLGYVQSVPSKDAVVRAWTASPRGRSTLATFERRRGNA